MKTTPEKPKELNMPTNAREYYFRDNATGKNFSVCCVKKMTALRRAWAKAGHHDLTFIAEGTP